MAKKPIVTVANDSESLISMILGAMVVVVIGALLFSYVRDWRKGKNTTNQPKAEQTAEPILTQELPESVKLEKNGDGQDVPVGLPAKYTVKAGDSTWKIAQAFYGSGFNYVDIEKENNLTHDQEIVEGATLTIPKVAVRGAARAAEPAKYSVAAGKADVTQVGPSKGDNSAAEAVLKSE